MRRKTTGGDAVTASPRIPNHELATQIASKYDELAVAGRGGVQPVEVISTGSIALDMALGVGGLPRRRVVEVFGPEGGGKTTLALHVIAEAQRNGGVAAFIDAECALDLSYAQRIGVDADATLYSQPDCGEDAFAAIEKLLENEQIDVIVVDSVPALLPKAVLEKDMGDAIVGANARLMSQCLPRVVASLGRSRATLLFINQLREKIGVMYGNPETTPGGRALPYYATVRVEVRPSAQSLDDRAERKAGTASGLAIRATVRKNKVAPPLRQAELRIRFGEGFDRTEDLIEAALRRDIIVLSGSWYRMHDENIAQGRAALYKLVAENEELSRLISEAVGVSPRL